MDMVSGLPFEGRSGRLNGRLAGNDDSMTSDESNSRKFAWGAWILFAVGAAVFLLGGWRFFGRHQFGYLDALYCCLTVIPAALLLLVFDYTVHHAKLVAVIPLVAAGVLAFSFPVFDVALGLALMGVVVGSVRN